MRIIAILLAMLMAFAGCTDKSAIPDDGNETEGDGDEGDDHGDGNHTAGNVTNTPPTVTLAANVTNEAAPFLVRFDINGTDADNDTISWQLDADGDGVMDSEGEGLPANATFEYAAAGTYNVTLNVTDGVNNGTLNLTLLLESGAAPLLPQWVGSGVAEAPCPQCREVGANTGAGYRGGESGVDSVFVTLPEGYAGYPFGATASSGDIDLSFRSSCSAGTAVGEPFAAAGAETGVVPEGAGCVLMWNYSTPDTTLTITVG